jgi:RecA-family ATPase
MDDDKPHAEQWDEKDPRSQERYERAKAKAKAKVNGADKAAQPLGDQADNGSAVVPRAWTIDDHIPSNNVTLLSGEGAVGKSILALQLAVCTALNAVSDHDHDWIGLLPKGGPAMVVSCEEDQNEMLRRLEDSAQHYHCDRADLKNLYMYSWVDRGSTLLATIDRKSGDNLLTTELYARLLVTVMQIKPKLIVLDTAADLFGGNEINRNHTRQFIAYMRRLALVAQNDTAVLLLTHPSLEGIRSGTGLSGSTAWHNSVRSRCVFKKLKDDEDSDDITDPNQRVLEWHKNNYGPPQDTAALCWKAGVFVVEGGSSTLEQQLYERNKETTTMTILRNRNRDNRAVSDRPGPNYAPAVFAKTPEAKAAKVSKRDFELAMERLFAAGRIKVVEVGPPSRRTRMIVEVERGRPDGPAD